MLHNGFSDSGLEIAVALAFEFAFDLVEGTAGDCGINPHQVVYTVLALGIAHAGVAVRHRALEFAHDVLRLIQQRDAAVGVFVGLAHLLGRILQGHNPRAVLRNVRIRHHEGGAVQAVEALRNVAGQLQMLLLIRTDRDQVRLIKEDIRSHQRRIGEQARIDVVRVFGGFILKLRHAGELAKLGVTVQNPRQFRMRMDMALHEEQALVYVDPAGQ